jgi:hypothetical protein
MKYHHLIVELSDKQKEFQAFFKKELKKFGVDSPAELNDEQKKEFFNAVDKGFKAKKESVEEGRAEFILRIKENMKLRRDLVNRISAPVIKEEDDDGMSKGAASDPEISGKKSQLIIEFPDEVRVEFVCKGDDVEDIKTRAQELHDEGAEVTEVTAKIAEEFPGCTFEIQGGTNPSDKGKKTEKNESGHLPGEKKKKKVRESFADYVSGIAQDPGKGVRDKKHDRVITERVENQLQRLNVLIAKIRNNIQETTPQTQRDLTVLVKENLEAVSEHLAESLEDDE